MAGWRSVAAAGGGARRCRRCSPTLLRMRGSWDGAQRARGRAAALAQRGARGRLLALGRGPALWSLACPPRSTSETKTWSRGPRPAPAGARRVSARMRPPSPCEAASSCEHCQQPSASIGALLRPLQPTFIMLSLSWRRPLHIGPGGGRAGALAPQRNASIAARSCSGGASQDAQPSTSDCGGGSPAPAPQVPPPALMRPRRRHLLVS
jgi:hypothetical protein